MFCGLKTEEKTTISVYDYVQETFSHTTCVHVFFPYMSSSCGYARVPYLSILCSLLGVMPLPLSVKVRQRWPASSTTSIQICLADTPGSDALSRTRKKELNYQQRKIDGQRLWGGRKQDFLSHSTLMIRIDSVFLLSGPEEEGNHACTVNIQAWS